MGRICLYREVPLGSVLGWAVLAAQKLLVATIKCFPPLRSVLRSPEGDGTAVGVSTVHMLVCVSARVRIGGHRLAAGRRAALVPELGKGGNGRKSVVLGSFFFCIWKSLLAWM